MLSRTSMLRGGLTLAATLLAGGLATAGDPCGDPAAGSCNEANGTPGCADATCCNTVCAVDAFCCDDQWDLSCVDYAVALCGGSAGCGDPASGDCTLPNGTPGCSDAECCSTVCGEDPYCCDVEWDSVCVSAANNYCYGGEPPANDTCETAIDLGSGDSVTPFSSIGALTDGIELPPECESVGENIIRADIWFTWTATMSGTAVFSTCDDADFDTRLALWEGECGAQTLLACNDDGLGCVDFTSQMVGTVVAGTTYYIQLGGYIPPAQGTGNLTICEGDTCLGGCGVSDPPPGDSCAAAIDLGTFQGDVLVDTNGTCTDGANLPAACVSAGSVTIYNDLFYRWTVPTTGDWSVSTCNQADFDTRLAAFDSCGGTLIACNDDGLNCGLSSLMPLPGLTAGQEIIIQIGGYAAASSGTATMTISEGDGQPEGPENDECEGAILVVSGDLAFENFGATSSGQSLPAECADFGNDQVNNDLWYLYEADCDGTVVLSFCGGATFDTKLAVYNAAEGCPVSGSVPIACNDDFCSLQSETSFTAVCGESYYFRVGTYSAGTFGAGTLSVTCNGESCGGGGNDCPADFNDDGVVNGADYGFLLSAWGSCAGCPEDLDGDGVVGGSDVGTLLAAWGACP